MTIQAIHEEQLLQAVVKSSCLEYHFLPKRYPFKEITHTISFQDVLNGQPHSTSKAMVPSAKDHFVNSILPFAKKAAAIIGLDPRVLIAQAVLETGWGQHVIKDNQGISSNNLFNIKSQQSDASIEINTTEYEADQPIKMKDTFKKYESIAESFDDYIEYITNHKRYREALAHVSDAKRYFTALYQAGYATDPHYVDKVLSIYENIF